VSSVVAEGAQAKLKRAKHHLEEFESRLKTDWNKNLYGIGTRDDLGTRETVVTLLKPRALFVEYAVIVGEIVHEMRSALEHVVWQMVPNPVEGRTGFPVFTLEKKDPANPNRGYYEGQGLRMINGIEPLAEAFIRKLQPFSTGTDQRLALLNQMWNWDKHRLLNTMIGFPRAISPWYHYLETGRRLFLDLVSVPELDHGAEIGRLPHPADFIPGKVRMEAEVEIAIRFIDAGPADGESPQELLASLFQFTESIVVRLAGFSDREASSQ
jgi:hypothetical protein